MKSALLQILILVLGLAALVSLIMQLLSDPIANRTLPSPTAPIAGTWVPEPPEAEMAPVAPVPLLHHVQRLEADQEAKQLRLELAGGQVVIGRINDAGVGSMSVTIIGTDGKPARWSCYQPGAQSALAVTDGDGNTRSFLPEP